jgi:hypothetical protein
MFSSWSLKKKLLAAFGLGAMLLALTCGIGYNGLSQSCVGLTLASEHYLPSIEELNMVEAGLMQVRMNCYLVQDRDQSDARRKDFTNRTNMGFERAEKAMATYEAKKLSQQERKKWDEFKGLWNAWKSDFHSFSKPAIESLST